MMRDNLVGLIEPMVYRAGVHSLAGHHQARQTGRCSRSTELAIVALKRSWRQIFRWKTGRRAENSNWPAWEMTTAAHDSRAVGTACHQSHRTIDPQCLTKSPPRRGGIFALTKNVASPVHAEPAHTKLKAGKCLLPKSIVEYALSGLSSLFKCSAISDANSGSFASPRMRRICSS